MKSNENNVKRIYDKPSKTWFEVTPEQYAEFDRWRTNKRKREQYHGRCMCKRDKWWLCDGMCEDCEFHAPGDTLSLDATTTNENGDETCLLDSIASPESDPGDIILDQILMRQLFPLSAIRYIPSRLPRERPARMLSWTMPPAQTALNPVHISIRQILESWHRSIMPL